jgi:hypothetical protein
MHSERVEMLSEINGFGHLRLSSFLHDVQLAVGRAARVGRLFYGRG